MARNYTTDAINLRSYDLSDDDKIIVMYSKDKGLIRSIAKGVKRPKSKLGARMDLLVANTLQFAKGKNLDTICQAQTINSFIKIRKDILKLLSSSYISEIVAFFGVENDPSSNRIYSLLYSALNKICISTEKKDILISVIKFQLKIMLILGIIPEFNTCLECGNQITDEDMYFSKEHCGVFCKACNSKLHVPVKLPYKLRDFLNAMLNYDFDYISDYDKKATDKVCIVCFKFLKDYLSTHCEKTFKTEKSLMEIL